MISGLFFVVTGLQYWISAYMTTVMGASAEQAAVYFVVMCFTGPICGVIVGGILTQKVGGYNSTKG
jgi:sugar phosphate permease